MDYYLGLSFGWALKVFRILLVMPRDARLIEDGLACEITDILTRNLLLVYRLGVGREDLHTNTLVVCFSLRQTWIHLRKAAKLSEKVGTFKFPASTKLPLSG